MKAPNFGSTVELKLFWYHDNLHTKFVTDNMATEIDIQSQAMLHVHYLSLAHALRALLPDVANNCSMKQ